MNLRDAFNQPVDRAASPSCPDDETLWKAAHGELDSETAGPILDHVAACSSCTESWRMAREIGERAGLSPEAKVLPFHRRPVVWGLVTLAASILVVSLFLPPILDRGPDAPADEFREPSGVALESHLDESVRLARDDLLLKWSAGPEGTLYTVELADSNLVVLGRSEPLNQPEFRVPAALLAEQTEGATVYWRIEAVLPDGTRVSSAVYVVRLQ